MTRTEEVHIENKIREALTRANLPHNHVIRDVLAAEAEFADAHSSVVVAQGVSLDQRIEELRDHPTYRTTFPAPPPTVAKGDWNELRENFSAICDGKILVE